jgi:DNA-binding winged helix-turn-helix (wHTH) protein/TolB-like protein/Tfp pilus assembly protein PilF
MFSGINALFDFGNFCLDPEQRVLLRDGIPMNLTPKAFEVLVVLVNRSGKLVEKEELLATVWPDVAVEEGNLAVMISHLRRVLGDDPEKHQFIETVPKHGYRFVANVTRTETRPPERALEPWMPTAPMPYATPIPPTPARWRFRWWGGLAVATLAAFAVILMWRSPLLKGASQADAGVIHSLAILPFQEIGNQKDNDFLGEGTADALVTRLGSIDAIIVRPASAMEGYRGSALNPVEIGKRQGVDAVLEGRMQREGDRVRLAVQLLRVRDGSALWADSFDEKVTDIFGLEDEIAQRVVQSLRIRLSNEDAKRIRRNPTAIPKAYEAYVEGRYFWNKRTESSVQRGLEYFRRSIQLDPNFAEAYEGIADSYAILGLYGSLPPNEAFPKARAAAEKALSMNDGLADAHATLGLIYFYYDWDGVAAENEFRHALDINPNYAMAHSWNGETLAAMGRFPEAVGEAQIAMDGDPLSLSVNTNAGWTFFLAGHTDQAIQILKKAIELDPAFPRSHFRLGMIYQAANNREGAVTEFKDAVQLSNGNPYYEASLANAYAAAGLRVEARRVMEDLENRAHSEYVPAFGFAIIYSALNDRENAFEWLRKASLDHSTSMAYAHVDPLLAGLRTDARFASVARSLKF